MRKSKFSETQIVDILKDAESGVPVADLLRKHGLEASSALPRVSTNTYRVSHSTVRAGLEVARGSK